MKRFFFTVIALSAVAVGCTKSGLLESPQTYEAPITFEPYTGKAPVTKATVANDETLMTGFRVFGFEHTGTTFDATTATPTLRKVVTGTETEGAETPTWTYTGDMFWPEGKYLSFVAYGLNVNGTYNIDNGTASPTYGDLSSEPTTTFVKTSDSYTQFTYTVPDTRTAQKDLIISAMQKNRNGGTVALRFYHVLSRVGFKVDIANPATGTAPVVVINNISLTGNFITQGTFDLTTAALVDDSGNLTFTPATDTTQRETTYNLFSGSESFTTTASGVQNVYSGTNDGDRFMMVMPGTIGKDPVEGVPAITPKITVDYSIAGVNQDPAEIDLPRTVVSESVSRPFTLLPGKAYEFVIKLSSVPVGFNVEVDVWDTDLNDNKDADDDITYPLS